ncbi:MAG: hypothetical protein CTY31_01155 [Hyphomicrobium sp.]|nr:MAG: hypothetical protein CTY39_11325 [Hyphomicrobium sp.]PPD01416.1 MAG: hypothetical protein CTY31_01155 [Hyphomicrobium sp.]
MRPVHASWSLIEGWPVTAHLHEALHLPIVRIRLAMSGKDYSTASNRTGRQHTGSLTSARTKRSL